MKAVLKNAAFFLFNICKYNYLCRQITSIINGNGIFRINKTN